MSDNLKIRLTAAEWNAVVDAFSYMENHLADEMGDAGADKADVSRAGVVDRARAYHKIRVALTTPAIRLRS